MEPNQPNITDPVEDDLILQNQIIQYRYLNSENVDKAFSVIRRVLRVQEGNPKIDSAFADLKRALLEYDNKPSDLDDISGMTGGFVNILAVHIATSDDSWESTAFEYKIHTASLTRILVKDYVKLLFSQDQVEPTIFREL